LFDAQFGWTPLIVATRGNYEEVVELILSHKPNTNANDAQGLTPLMTACKEGNINIVNLLLYHGAYVNLTDGNGDTSLIHASKSGYLPIVEALIKAHAGVDHQGAERKTALYNAVEKGHLEVIKALLKANANFELCTREGDTPLMKSVRSRRIQAVRLLLDRKAKVSPTDRYGDCALHIAARAQSRAILELLLRNPHNSQLLYRPNAQGETAFQLDAAHPKPLLPTLFGAAPSARRVLEKETQLGYDLYSSAIANLLSEPGLKTPLCVGLFAKWGSGKSFLLGRLCKDLAAFGTPRITSPTRLSRAGCECGSLLFKLFALPISAVSYLFGLFLSHYYTGSITLDLSVWLFVIISVTMSLVCLALTSVGLHLAHRRYDWPSARNTCARLRRIQLLVHVMFSHPPQLEFDQLTSNPVRFLFIEQPVKLSTEHSAGQLVAEIQRALWSAVQAQYGYLPVRLFRVFNPKPCKYILLFSA
jgi:ankyrin repeat-rich membrane spanning protein